VIAVSFSQTYKRNAFNNGYLVLDSPELYDALHKQLADRAEPTIAGPEITIDFTSSRISVDDQEHPFSPLSTVAQELIVAGGAENIVRSRLAADAV
jgi:homoaconitate hydratase